MAKHPSKASMGQHNEHALMDRKEPAPKGSAWTTVWKLCLEPKAAAGRAEPSTTCHLLPWEIKTHCRAAASGSEVICGKSSSGRAADSPVNACWHTSIQVQMSKPTPSRFWYAGSYHLNYKSKQHLPAKFFSVPCFSLLNNMNEIIGEYERYPFPFNSKLGLKVSKNMPKIYVKELKKGKKSKN